MNPSEEKAKAPEKTKALCVATRCATIEQFVATFHRFCDESSFFVATLATRPVGLETAFSIQLEDKTPVLRGLCVVVEAWSTPANRFGRPGVRLSVRRLTNESLPVFKQLQAARIAAEAAEKAKDSDGKPVEAAKLESKPVAAKSDAKPVEKPPEKPKTLADKLAEIKSQPKPPAIPPRKTDAMPPIPAGPPILPKINPTAFAVKPAPARAPNPTPSIIIEIDEPTKIEAKTVRAEGTAPVMRAVPSEMKSVETKPIGSKGDSIASKAVDVGGASGRDAKSVDTKPVDAKGVDAKGVDAKGVDAKGVDAKGVDAKGVDAKGVDAKGVDAKGVDAKSGEEPTATGPAPIGATAASNAPAASTAPSNAPAASTAPSNAPASTAPSNAPASTAAVSTAAVSTAAVSTAAVSTAASNATGAPTATASTIASAPTMGTSAPMEAPSRPTPPPRAANVTTPAIGISTSTLNLSNAALTAEDTHAQARSYSDAASIVDAPPRSDTPARPDAARSDAHARADAVTAGAVTAGAPSRADAKGRAPSMADASFDVNPATPEHIAASDDMTSPVASESRAPGSNFILPANPLMNLSDKSLEGFVDCALYEETGNFFRAPGYEDSLVDIDEVAHPPGVLAPAQAIRPGDEVSQAAYVITPTPAYVTQHAQQDLTPVPVMGRNPTQPPYPTGQMAPLGYSQPYATGQMPPMQYPTGQMPPMQYPTGQMPPMQYPNGQPYPTGQMPPIGYPQAQGYATGQMPPMQYQTGQMPPLQTGNPPYGTPGPRDSTVALLAMSAPNRRRWMIIGGAAVLASILLLVIVIATRGGDKTATAATTPHTGEKKAGEDKVTMAVTQTPTTQTPETTPTKVPTAPVVTPDDEEHATASDPNAPPVMGSGPCTLTVTTTPAGSIVRLDDQVMGPSPITIQGPCSRRRVDVKHARYAPGMKWVTLAQGKAASVDIPLNRPTHAVTIVTQPAGATISIAGRRAGTSPTAVQMMGFTKVALTIEKKGYKTVVESIYSKSDGERRTVTLTRAK